VGLITAVVILLSACFSDDSITPDEQLKEDLDLVDKVQLDIDIAIIDSYLIENEIEAFEHESGLRYVIHEEGDGPIPELADKVKVDYEGRLLGETETFEKRTETFDLKTLILGWRVGFQLLHEGDSATLYIPSGLGYGEAGNVTIPPNANLTFGVKLIDVERF